MEFKREINPVENTACTVDQYKDFLTTSWELLSKSGSYLSADEDVNCLELAHLIPDVAESMLTIYVGINDAVCNKGLVTALLPNHGHNIVFAFDPQVYSGGDDVPSGTVDTRSILKSFEPPNETWDPNWTYVVIEDPSRTFDSLWKEKGYIEMIPAKFEDFKMLSDPAESKVCTFISPKAFDHPVNMNRPYLKAARQRGEKMANQFLVPELIKDEFAGLEPVILNKGEKLYVATTDFGPCPHGWTNIHPDNKTLAVVDEVSAVPLDLVIAKPPVNQKYSKGLIPPKGSADMTTDTFKRGQKVLRTPILQGLFKG